MKTFPEKRAGKWAVGLTAVYLLTLATFFLFMLAGVVDFDTGHWWDTVILFVVPIELLAFVLSIIAIRKEKPF